MCGQEKGVDDGRS